MIDFPEMGYNNPELRTLSQLPIVFLAQEDFALFETTISAYHYLFTLSFFLALNMNCHLLFGFGYNNTWCVILAQF
jgi:hypothetical protein